MNNHTNRELEATFFQEFHWTYQSLRVVSHSIYLLFLSLYIQTVILAQHPQNTIQSEIAQIILKATNKDVAQLLYLKPSYRTLRNSTGVLAKNINFHHIVKIN